MERDDPVKFIATEQGTGRAEKYLPFVCFNISFNDAELWKNVYQVLPSDLVQNHPKYDLVLSSLEKLNLSPLSSRRAVLNAEQLIADVQKEHLNIRDVLFNSSASGSHIQQMVQTAMKRAEQVLKLPLNREHDPLYKNMVCQFVKNTPVMIKGHKTRFATSVYSNWSINVERGMWSSRRTGIS